MRPLTIKLDEELPLRASPLSDDAISKLWGGCYHENHTCSTDSDCCHESINDTGSGHYVLKCIGSTSGATRWCVFV